MARVARNLLGSTAARSTAARSTAAAHGAGVLTVIGTDAGGLAGLAPSRLEWLRGAQLLLAPKRLLAEVVSWWQAEQSAGRISAASPCPELLASDRPEQIVGPVGEALAAGHPAVLLASGDPLWFGIGRLLLQHFAPGQLRFYPAPSSLQLAFSRLGRPWQDASWVSLHGRDPEPLAAALQKRPGALAVLTDPGRGGADEVRRILRASGLEAAYGFWLCERLGHPQERVQRLEPSAPIPADLDPLHLVVLLAEPPAPMPAESLPLFGLDDGLYLQHDDRPGLMTKREIRIQVLAELELPASGVLWDIGAGVGSIGLEALRLAAIAEGRAPQALAYLPDPDRVVIGGGGKDRALILQAVLERLRPAGVVVIPLATIEALAELRPLLEQAGLAVRVGQLQAWRGAALTDGTRLAPLNPVLLRGESPPLCLV
jgi:precorrin-6B C5,15-methyltransferase / cobalt-precorrin-6B C5,C15-methyltransferase